MPAGCVSRARAFGTINAPSQTGASMATHKDEVLAERELHRLGYDESIFAFDHVPEKKLLGADTVDPLVGVLVTNTENQEQRSYRTEAGTPWTTRFIEDVRAGVFGPPPKGLTGVHAK
jgi:hypothetical protein